MSSTFFDAGDLQRLDRERLLTEQAPRALPEEDRSPVEEPIRGLSDEFEDILIDGFLEVLRERLK